MRSARATEALIARTLAAAKLAGLPVASFEVRPDGSVLVRTGDAAHSPGGEEDACDKAFGLAR